MRNNNLHHKPRYLCSGAYIWILCSIFCLMGGSAFAAYLENVPVTLTQPDGTAIECFATGDEYYNWVHDKDGYTIVQNPTTGYYCYAILQGDELVASQYVVGKSNPLNTTLKPHVNISLEKILAQRERISEGIRPKVAITSTSRQSKSVVGTLNNIIVYIRFADQTEFSAEQSIYTNLFNGETGNSMKNYFKEISYNRLYINSYFYPQNNGSTIISYQDSHERNYYCPYNAVSNPVGYNDNERTTREHNLLINAINYIKDQIPASLNLDYDNDGYVDNICFIIKGSITSSWNTLLWPHRWGLYTKTITINGKKVYDYNLQLENSIKPSNNGVLCHEMGHTLGAPDLYHYSKNDGSSVAGTPVGVWDVMATNKNPPQYMSTHIKQKYMGWISSIPTISSSGVYSLNPSSIPTNNCYKLALKNDNEYLVLEYRKKTGTFESSIPNSGLIIYRINTDYNGNSKGDGYANTKDEIYVFRPNGSISSDGNIDEAYFSVASGRTKFSKTTNPYCILSSGTKGNVYIRNIRENSDGTLSFELGCVDEEIVYSNTSSLPSHTLAKGRIKTSGSVVVKTNDNITFEATDDIILNAGFEIQKGGVFQTIGDACE